MSNEPKREITIDEAGIEYRIFKNAVTLSDQIITQANEFLSYWGLTVLQYSALKVIYKEDVNNEGLSSKEIGSKLYTRVPDVTRLLDRLVSKGWLVRERDAINRRVVRTRLTIEGVRLVEQIYVPMKSLESQQQANLSIEEKEVLEQLLSKATTAK